MRHNSESLDIKAVIGGNSLLFEDIKISLGLLMTARAIFGKSLPLQTIELESRTQNSEQILVLSDPIK